MRLAKAGDRQFAKKGLFAFDPRLAKR